MVTARLARAVQECNISQPVWLALPLPRMVGLRPGIMMAMAAVLLAGLVMAMAAILLARLVIAAMMLPAILAVG